MSSAIIKQSVLSPNQNKQSGNWNHPIPLTHVLNNETPYPFDALPNILQQVVHAYQSYGQQPLPLVASGALANLSLACQTGIISIVDLFLILLYAIRYRLAYGDGNENRDPIHCSMLRYCHWENN